MAYVEIDDFLCECYSLRWILKCLNLPEPKVCLKCKSCQWNAPTQGQPLPQRPSPSPQSNPARADTSDSRVLGRVTKLRVWC